MIKESGSLPVPCRQYRCADGLRYADTGNRHLGAGSGRAHRRRRHRIAERRIVRDTVAAIVREFQIWIADPGVDVIVTTAGAGVTGRDVTLEAVRAVIDKEIPGFGELFRWISFQKIRTSTI